MTDDEDISDIVAPPQIPPPSSPLRPGIVYAFEYQTGQWEAIGTADPEQVFAPAYPVRAVEWTGTDETVTVTVSFNDLTGESLARWYTGGRITSVTSIEETSDDDIVERIDGTLEDWERRRDAARWHPGLDEGA